MPQTVLNAIRDGLLAADVYVLGPNHTVVAIGIRPEAAMNWVPRKQGRPKTLRTPVGPVGKKRGKKAKTTSR
jgi:hypothetical protein